VSDSGDQGSWRSNLSLPLFENYRIIEQPVNIQTLSEKYGDKSIEYITKAVHDPSKKPFFLYLAWSHMHVPVGHDPKFTNATGYGVYADALFELDFHIGRVVDAIKSLGIADNTLILVAGDNGPPQVQCQFAGSVGPFLGQWQAARHGGSGKGSNWEGGHREVGLAVWPGKISGGRTSPALTSTLDYLPTIAKLAGFSLPKDRVFDGIDITPVLFDGVEQGHKTLFHQRATGGNGELTALRVGKYKAHFITGPSQPRCLGKTLPATHHKQPLIFDLSVDPAEAHPLAVGSKRYKTAEAAVQRAVGDYNKSFARDHKSAVHWNSDPKIAPCCNKKNLACRCSCK